jgi:RNA polymerase sigma factor (sigma-70 family)
MPSETAPAAVPLPGRESPAPERFEDFYLREFRSVTGLAYVLSGSRLAAEDIAQEAFAAAHAGWDRVRRLDRPGAWVRRVAANLAARSVRRRLLEARVLARGALGGDAPAVAELPADAAEVWQAVRRLPRRQAQAVALHYLAGYPLHETAALLGCAEGTVKTHLHRARATLARWLGEEVDP